MAQESRSSSRAPLIVALSLLVLVGLTTGYLLVEVIRLRDQVAKVEATAEKRRDDMGFILTSLITSQTRQSEETQTALNKLENENDDQQNDLQDIRGCL